MRVRSPEIARFSGLLSASAIAFRTIAPDTIVIDGATPEWLGPVLAEHQIVVYEVIHEKGSLEDVFLNLTRGFEASLPGGGHAPGSGPMGGAPADAPPGAPPGPPPAAPPGPPPAAPGALPGGPS
jgi:hypothetical protein